MTEEFDDTYEDDDFEDEIGGEGNRIVGARSLAVTEYVTRNLADDPDAIEVDVEERGGEVALLVPRTRTTWVGSSASAAG